MNNFRFVNNNDYDKGLIELYNQLSISPAISKDIFTEFVLGLHASHNIVVLEEDGKIIACTTLLIEYKLLRGLSRVLHIEDVVVDNNNRGRGLGKSILQYVINYAKENGCYKTILDCSDENTRFYEKVGFVRKGNQMSIYF
jgi:glucosamine-phosphate N-acetyltransferase